MTYDIYRYIFIGSAGLAALCLILAVILFFVLKIPRVIGDLSGSTARKAIENIRNQNESTGNKTYKSSKVNQARGMVTDKITASGSVIKPLVDISNGAMATTKISTSRLETEALESYETSLLNNNISGETTVLSAYGSGETTVLDSFSNGETTVLDEANFDAFTIEYELMFIHTDEIIA